MANDPITITREYDDGFKQNFTLVWDGTGHPTNALEPKKLVWGKDKATEATMEFSAGPLIPPLTNPDLALARPATSSSVDDPSRPAGLAVDGKTTTRWSSAYTDAEWIQVDLGAIHQISEVVLLWEAAFGKAYLIQVSNDAKTWTSIYATTTGAGGQETLKLAGSGRYVRMLGQTRATQWGYSLWEFSIYGSVTLEPENISRPTISGSPIL